VFARPRLPAAALVLLALLLLAATASAAPPSQRVIPIWAGIKHGKPVKGGTVVARTRGGRLLAPPARIGAAGVASLMAAEKPPRGFVVEVRRGGSGKMREKGPRTVLRATVRDWTGPRVVYVDPFSTISHEYGKLHARLSDRGASMRVQRHLGIGPRTRSPEAATFWSERAFSGRRFAQVAARRGGIVAYSRRIAREVDRSHKPHRFRLKSHGKRGKGHAQGKGHASGKGAASASATAHLASVSPTELNANRLQTERELMAAAQAAVSLATGSPSAILQIGKLLDALLGGGDTAELKQIATQLATLQTGINDLEQQVSAVDTEVSLAAYSSATESYRGTKETIDLLWEDYVHAAAAAAAGNSAEAKAETEALVGELKGWTNTVPSSQAVPYDEGAPGLMAWAQNAMAKGLDGGVLTAANQQVVRAAGFQWWSYWAKDLILHTEKWDNPETAGSISARNVETLSKNALKGLEAAETDEYGEALPATVVYSINAGTLYSVGTVWNVKPTVIPAQAGQPEWALMTKEQAASLPANAVGLREAMVASVPTYPANPNSSMNGIFGAQPNNGTWPTYAGTGGGYGVPPANTSTFALNSATNGSCNGQWQWYTNGQGASNTTGAPIIVLCPAFDALNQTVESAVCSQVSNPGVFYGWSNNFPVADWNGIWRREKAIEFKTCNEIDKWQNESKNDPSLNWGDGVFEGDAPLSVALDISNSPSAYYALWTRPIGPADKFLVGPVTNSG
jgi:hypothetical protein